VDEALSVGAVFFQSKCYRKFEDFKREGKTILFVSHDLSAISRYCDRAVLLNQGDKVYEGTPKEAIDIYKKVLVDQFHQGSGTADAADGSASEASGAGAAEGEDSWKRQFPVNPALVEYGEKHAEIVDYGLFDEKGLPTSNFLKGTEFTVKMRIRAHETVREPIFAFTIKNMKGIEICGTNTTMEKIPVPTMEDGDEHVVTFTQKIDLQGGEYLLSLGCTGYQDGMFRVFHRLYDVLSLSVVSARDTVGFYDMNSTCRLDPEEEDGGV
jgi:teichoic acid transport system ATP-binding protein